MRVGAQAGYRRVGVRAGQLQLDVAVELLEALVAVELGLVRAEQASERLLQVRTLH